MQFTSRLSAFTAAFFVASALVAAPAHAVPGEQGFSAQTATEVDRQGDASEVSLADAEGEVPPVGPEGSVYVQANSPEEAEVILDGLESQGSAAAPRAAGRVNYGPCIIQAEGTHLRKSGAYGKVGIKTKTTCSKNVTSINHDTSFREKGLINWKKVGRDENRKSANRNAKSLYTQNAEFTCRGKGKHWWSGSTLGTMVYGGKTYYARAYAPVSSKKLECNS